MGLIRSGRISFKLSLKPMAAYFTSFLIQVISSEKIFNNEGTFDLN